MSVACGRYGGSLGTTEVRMTQAARRGQRGGVDEFLKVPYLDRKFVLVVDDEVLDATRSLDTDLSLVDETEWKETLVEVNGLSPTVSVPREWIEAREISKKAKDGRIAALSLLAQEDALLLDF